MEEKVVMVPRCLGNLQVLSAANKLVEGMGGQHRGIFPPGNVWHMLGFLWLLKARTEDFKALEELGIHELV